jgi:hypothetical protein
MILYEYIYILYSKNNLVNILKLKFKFYFNKSLLTVVDFII